MGDKLTNVVQTLYQNFDFGNRNYNSDTLHWLKMNDALQKSTNKKTFFFRGKKSISYCTLLSVLWYLRQIFTFPTDIKNKIETKLATYCGINIIVAFQKHILAFDWKG